MRAQTILVVFLVVIICTFDFIDSSKKDVNSKDKKNSAAKKSPSRFRGFFFLVCLIGVVFAGIFIYYLFLCHPILCRKERNYDVVEHSRDTTPTRNIEKTP